jgi:predicted glycoside hydrolase/deacetylase ChbG (UPF0249 family)
VLTNAGIIRAHEHGIVTSASLMVLRPAAREAAQYACSATRLSVGLHIEGEHDARSQLDAFRALMGRDPTHVDSHRYVHRREPLTSIARALAAELGVPLREHSEIHYIESFYGSPDPGAVEVPALLAIIGRLARGTSELSCHPGLDEQLQSTYVQPRLTEVQTLCDPRVREALGAAEVQLRTF